MPKSTYLSFLMQKSADTYTKLVDIKDYPDLGGEPELLAYTTLSHGSEVYIPGLESAEAMAFTVNYEKDTFDAITALKGQELDLAVWFGGTVAADGTATPTGADGKFSFKGYVYIRVSGKGVNEVREAVVTVVRSSEIVSASV